MDYGIAQVGACGAGGEDLKVEAEGLLEVVAYVLHDFLLCRGGEAGYWNWLGALFELLVAADELADV